MDLCNKYNKMDYEVAPTLFLEFHGSEETVLSEAKQVNNATLYNLQLPQIHSGKPIIEVDVPNFY